MASRDLARKRKNRHEHSASRQSVGGIAMRKFALCLTAMLIPVLGYGQVDEQKFKKEAPAFERALRRVADVILPDYGLVQPPHTAYLDGYGPVFVIEVALERSANPFFTPVAADVKESVERRLKELKEKIPDLL